MCHFYQGSGDLVTSLDHLSYFEHTYASAESTRSVRKVLLLPSYHHIDTIHTMWLLMGDAD